MIALIKAEIRKLFSIRSTYVILAICLAMELLFGFYIVGWHTSPATFTNPTYLGSQAIMAISALTLFLGLISILMVTHEYRYNTIMYTLTSSRSRTRVLLAKLIVISGFAVVFSLVFGSLSPLLSQAAIHVRGFNLADQYIAVWSLLWRVVFAGWGFAMLAFILAMIIRVQVGALAAMFLMPSAIEGMLGLLLKSKQVYLPFTSLGILLDGQTAGGGHISYVRGALIAGTYILIGWVVAWILFLRRDAN